MELRHLRHFVAVAEELHMGRAARRLGMAQPPLSQSIARLEAALGIRLFERANRRLSLTRAGAEMLEDARASLRHAGMAEDRARAALAGTAGEITIGFVSAALYKHLPAVFGELRKRHPGISPKLVELSTNEQIEALASGEIDLGFAHPPLGAAQPFHIREFPPEDLIAVVPDDGRTGPVSLGEIAQRGLILFPAAQGPALRAGILDAFTKAGLTVGVTQEASRALTMLSLVSAGLGVALLPRSTSRVEFRGVLFVDVVDGADLPRIALAMIAPKRPRWPVIDTLLGIGDAAG